MARGALGRDGSQVKAESKALPAETQPAEQVLRTITYSHLPKTLVIRDGLHGSGSVEYGTRIISLPFGAYQEFQYQVAEVSKGDPARLGEVTRLWFINKWHELNHPKRR